MRPAGSFLPEEQRVLFGLEFPDVQSRFGAFAAVDAAGKFRDDDFRGGTDDGFVEMPAVGQTFFIADGDMEVAVGFLFHRVNRAGQREHFKRALERVGLIVLRGYVVDAHDDLFDGAKPLNHGQLDGFFFCDLHQRGDDFIAGVEPHEDVLLVDVFIFHSDPSCLNHSPFPDKILPAALPFWDFSAGTNDRLTISITLTIIYLATTKRLPDSQYELADAFLE